MGRPGPRGRRRGARARNLTELGGVEYLAALLNGAHTSGAKPIVAVVRGRQEFGPRALGRRSLLAVPDSVDARNRLNRLKRRQWYRPVAPMVAEEAMADAFGRSVPSPYMTMAPDVSPPIARAFPALAHLDGTARHQSVARRDDAWLHALLRAVGKRTGLAALIIRLLQHTRQTHLQYVKAGVDHARRRAGPRLPPRRRPALRQVRHSQGRRGTLNND